MKVLLLSLICIFPLLLGAEEKKHLGLYAIKEIEGFSELPKEKHFNWISIRGRINLMMTWQTEGIINQVEWSVMCEDGYPVFNFYDLMARVQEAEEILTRFPWLKEWRESSRENHVKITIYENHFSPGDKMHSQDIWKRIPMAGDPAIEIRLNGEDNWRANFQFGKEESRAQLTYVSGALEGSALWYQQIPHYSDWSNENYPVKYILISKNGERITNITDSKYFQGVLPESTYKQNGSNNKGSSPSFVPQLG